MSMHLNNIEFVAFNIMLDDLVFHDGRTSMEVLGGGGPQTAAGMRLWSKHVGLYGSVGPDFPPALMKWLVESGIDLEGVRTNATQTARAWQVLEKNGMRTQVWRVKKEVRKEQLSRSIEKLPRAYHDAKGFHLGVHPLFPDHSFIAKLREIGGIVSIESFCPADRRPDESDLTQLLQAADIFSLNEHEAVSLVGEGQPKDLALRLISAGAKLLSLRLGGNGSLVVDGQKGLAFHIPAISVQVVDAVGAGNAYCGGFLVGWCESHDPETAGVYGAVASSFMLEQIGSPALTPEIIQEGRRRVDRLWPKVRPVAI